MRGSVRPARVERLVRREVGEHIKSHSRKPWLIQLFCGFITCKLPRPGSSAFPLAHRENRDAVPFCTFRGLRNITSGGQLLMYRSNRSVADTLYTGHAFRDPTVSAGCSV
jgi:hypothetical protein